MSEERRQQRVSQVQLSISKGVGNGRHVSHVFQEVQRSFVHLLRFCNIQFVFKFTMMLLPFDNTRFGDCRCLVLNASRFFFLKLGRSQKKLQGSFNTVLSAT